MWGEEERSRRFGGRKGEKCLVRRRGPMVLTAKVCWIWDWSNWAGDFSG